MNIDTNGQDQSRLDNAFKKYKVVKLTLFDDGGQPIGHMRPLTVFDLANIELIQNLTDWRNENMSCFLTQFTATTLRTRSWLQNTVLKDYRQMLWLVYEQNDELVGHFGFKNLTSHTVMLDNAMRGKRMGSPKLFVEAGKALVKWLFDSTSVHRIEGILFTDNVPSIMLCRAIGFQGWTILPFSAVNAEGNIPCTPEKKPQSTIDSRQCFFVWINRGGLQCV